MIRDLTTVTTTRADFTAPDTVLATRLIGLLDLEQPVALLVIGCRHLAGGDADAVISLNRSPSRTERAAYSRSARQRRRRRPDQAARMRAVSGTFAATASPVTFAPTPRTSELIGDFDLAEPRLVMVSGHAGAVHSAA